MEEKFIQETKNLLAFINKSPSCFQVVKNIEDILNDNGFIKLDEKKRFKIESGKNYYVCRNNSALIAFKVPLKFKGLSIIASHTDSPSFKVKVNPEIVKEGKYTTLNVEGYGGMLCAPWFDRPLSIAGRVFIETSTGIKEELINFDKDLVSIVNLAIHQNKKANDGYSYKKQKDMLPIFGLGDNKEALNSLIAKELKVDKSLIIDSDLFLYNRMKGTIWGLNEDLYSSSRIDDLQCAYSSVRALTESSDTTSLSLCALLDNEEVGSGTKQGALGDFMESIIKRIGFSLNWDVEDSAINQAESFMLSADNGHALHPNYTEVCDLVNRPVPNGGVLIKYSANQKYTTDAKSASIFKNILKKNGIPYQEFVNHSDQPGGSTLGNLSNTHYSINTVDMGAAQLAMHSPFETGGTKDTYYLINAMKAFYER